MGYNYRRKYISVMAENIDVINEEDLIVIA